MPMLPPQIVLLGDSLFEFSVPVQNGFSLHAELQSYYIRRYDVINRGFSGYNTENIITRLDQILQPPSETVAPIKYLAILLGANDACLELPTTCQHVDLEEYKSYLRKIIIHPIIKAHNPTIILVTPPPYNEIKAIPLDLASGHLSTTRTSVVTATYAQAARDVAGEFPAVKLADLWKGIMDKAIEMEGKGFKYEEFGAWLGDPKTGRQGGLDTLLLDGLHLNGDAYRVMHKLLMEHLPKVSQERERREDYVFPVWSVVNADRKKTA